MTYKQKAELVKMIRWAINRLFDEHDDMVMNGNELHKAAQEAWNSLFEDGTLRKVKQE